MKSSQQSVTSVCSGMAAGKRICKGNHVAGQRSKFWIFFQLHSRIRHKNSPRPAPCRTGDISVFLRRRLGNRLNWAGVCRGKTNPFDVNLHMASNRAQRGSALLQRTIRCINNKNSRLAETGAVPGLVRACAGLVSGGATAMQHASLASPCGPHGEVSGHRMPWPTLHDQDGGK